MKGKHEELRIPMKSEKAVSNLLKVKPPKNKPKDKKPPSSSKD
jgi:hypothetical protein